MEISSNKKSIIALKYIIASASSNMVSVLSSEWDTFRAYKRGTVWKSFYFQESQSTNLRIKKYMVPFSF